MRVGIFSESYEPVINGVAVCVQTLRDELVRSGHEVVVFAPYYRGFKDPYAHVFRFPSWRTPFAPDYPLPLPFSRSMKKAFASSDLDIVHTQTPFLLGILGARWARQRGIPVVSTNHTLYTEYAHYAPLLPKKLVARVLIAHMRRYYNGCDAVATPSRPARERLIGYGVRTRIEVIAGGVNAGAPAIEDGFRERIGLPGRAKALLYVGRLAKEKNLDMLLSAFQLVLREAPETWLVVVGGGPYEKALQEHARDLGVDERVIFVGPMAPSQVRSAYTVGDVFLWPSVTETQGLAVCEALSAGLPCVAVRAGGTPECVREEVDGLLTNNDTREFAESALKLLRDDGLRRRMAKEAAKNASRFSTAETAAKFLDLYSSVISERRKGA